VRISLSRGGDRKTRMVWKNEEESCRRMILSAFRVALDPGGVVIDQRCGVVKNEAK